MFAIALDGAIVHGERNLLADTAVPGFEGARAALETFYYAFNTRSVDLLRQIWTDDPLAQLDTPLADLIRGSANISAVYDRIRSSLVEMHTDLSNIVAYGSPGLTIFTEREDATSTQDSERRAVNEKLSGRSICIFHFVTGVGWRLIFHQVSLDDQDQHAKSQQGLLGR